MGALYLIAKAIASTSGWVETQDYPGSPGYDQSTNNSSGFNIYPFGTITPEGVPVNGANNSVLWCSTEITTETARRRYLYFGNEYLGISSAENKKNGFSVRLVKD